MVYDLIKSIKSKICIDSELFVLFGGHHAGFLILSHSSLEKVSFSLEGDHLHPVEGVFGIPQLRHAEGTKQSIGHAFNVLDH